MKVSFLVKAKDPNVITEKGVRTFIMERLLNSGFEKGSAVNIDDKTVEVKIEGDKEDIIKFKAQLEKDAVAKFGNPIISFTDLMENPATEIPSLMKSSQALMLGQLSKGIDVQLSILDTLKNMNQNMGSMSQGMKSMSTGMGTMNKDLKGELSSMNKDLKIEFKTLGQELKNLPRGLAKAIKEK